MNALSDTTPTQPIAISPPTPAPIAVLAKKSGRGRAIRLGVLLAVLIVGFVIGNHWWVEWRWIESTDNAYVQGDIVVLSPRIDGDIVQLHVADNQRVAAGAPLISLDPADWQARLDQANGAAAEAAAAITTARRTLDASRSQIAQADAMIEQARAEQVRATADAGRSTALVGAGWTSRQADDLAVATARKAEAGVMAARAQRASAVQAQAVAEAQVAQAEQRLLTARSTVTLAQNNLGYTVIRAPFDGIVGNRAAQLGMHVVPGQQLIALAPPPERLFVIGNFKETQLRLIAPGQKVLLTGDIDPGHPVAGRVISIAPATGALFSLLPPENATGNFTKIVQRVPVKLALDPAQAAHATWLRAGLSVVAEVDTRGPDAERRGVWGSLLTTLHVR